MKKQPPRALPLQGGDDRFYNPLMRDAHNNCKLKVISVVLLVTLAVNCFYFIFLPQGTYRGSSSELIYGGHGAHIQEPRIFQPHSSMSTVVGADSAASDSNNISMVASTSTKLNVSTTLNVSSDLCRIVNNQRVTGTWNDTCDIYRGKWVPDPRPSLYTNNTCSYIFNNQDCMTNGRPDREYLQWKWKPQTCDLPPFDALYFLEAVRGQRMLFVGDSIARNHMQSLLCTLAQVEGPQNVGIGEWAFRSYSFVLKLAWSPFLVNYTILQAEEQRLWRLQLDKLDDAWASSLDSYDYAIVSTTNWYFRNSHYYKGEQLMGIYDPDNIKSNIWIMFNAMEEVWKTVTQKLAWGYRGVGIIRTVTVSHFSDNSWKGGTCNKTRPDVEEMYRGEEELPWTTKQIYNIQQRAVEGTDGRVELLDVTYNTLWRADGHPGRYRVQKSEQLRQDCVHWCLPGPVDSWNQLLFQIVLPFSSCSA